MPDHDAANTKAIESAVEAFQRFNDLEADLGRLGADWEAERDVPALGGANSRGWVVVAVDRLLNGRPAVRNVFGPFLALEEARRYAETIEENGTRIFVAGMSDPARLPGTAGPDVASPSR